MVRAGFHFLPTISLSMPDFIGYLVILCPDFFYYYSHIVIIVFIYDDWIFRLIIFNSFVMFHQVNIKFTSKSTMVLHINKKVQTKMLYDNV